MKCNAMRYGDKLVGSVQAGKLVAVMSDGKMKGQRMLEVAGWFVLIIVVGCGGVSV